MNKLDTNKFLPEYFNEEDKVEYEFLYNEANKLYPNIKHEFILQTCIIDYINKKNGYTNDREISEEELNQIMSKYDFENTEYETPYDETYNFNEVLEEVNNVITQN
jgi:hypothetical protein